MLVSLNDRVANSKFIQEQNTVVTSPHCPKAIQDHSIQTISKMSLAVPIELANTKTSPHNFNKTQMRSIWPSCTVNLCLRTQF